MSLNNSQMLPARVRNMRQMNDVLNAEDIILAELKESELPGAAISEIGLYDADGDIVTIKRFTAKGKDADISMTFYINDTF